MNVHDDESLGLIPLLKNAELAVRSCIEETLAPFDLTPALFLMLFRLGESDGASSAELARTVGVRPQSIVTVIKPLEQAKLIRRKQDPEHGRILRVYLTAAGRRLLASAVPAARTLESELFACLKSSQLTELRAALLAIVRTARAHESHRRGTPAAQPDTSLEDLTAGRRRSRSR